MEAVETKRQAELKAQKMIEVAQQNEHLEQLKKQEFYAKQAEAEQRKQEIEAEKQKMLEQKRLEDL